MTFGERLDRGRRRCRVHDDERRVSHQLLDELIAKLPDHGVGPGGEKREERPALAFADRHRRAAPQRHTLGGLHPHYLRACVDHELREVCAGDAVREIDDSNVREGHGANFIRRGARPPTTGGKEFERPVRTALINPERCPSE